MFKVISNDGNEMFVHIDGGVARFPRPEEVSIESFLEDFVPGQGLKPGHTFECIDDQVGEC